MVADSRRLQKPVYRPHERRFLHCWHSIPERTGCALCQRQATFSFVSILNSCGLNQSANAAAATPLSGTDTAEGATTSDPCSLPRLSAHSHFPSRAFLYQILFVFTAASCLKLVYSHFHLVLSKLPSVPRLAANLFEVRGCQTALLWWTFCLLVRNNRGEATASWTSRLPSLSIHKRAPLVNISRSSIFFLSYSRKKTATFW